MNGEMRYYRELSMFTVYVLIFFFVFHYTSYAHHLNSLRESTITRERQRETHFCILSTFCLDDLTPGCRTRERRETEDRYHAEVSALI